MSYGHGLALAVAAAALSAPVVRRDGETFPGGVPTDPRDRDPIPDRVSIEQDSPYYFAGYPMLNVQINGRDSSQVVEYCQSEGWARLCLRDGRGKMKRDQRGQPITTTVSGTIRPYWRDQPLSNVAVVLPSSAPQFDDCPGKTGEKPAISREQVRRMRQKAAKEAKDAARAARRDG